MIYIKRGAVGPTKFTCAFLDIYIYFLHIPTLFKAGIFYFFKVAFKINPNIWFRGLQLPTGITIRLSFSGNEKSAELPFISLAHSAH